MLREVTEIEKSKVMHSFLTAYLKYTILKENSVLENAGIHFVLHGSRAMSEEERHSWAQLVRQDVLPKLDIISNESEVHKISGLIITEQFNKMISLERAMILHEASKGKYSVSIEGWINKISQKMEYFREVQLLLREEIQNIEQAYLAKKRWPVIALMTVALILLIGLLRLFSLYFKRQRDQSISADTLKDIALVFNDNQQKEIKRLIENGKVDHIYKFLIQAIKDANQLLLGLNLLKNQDGSILSDQRERGQASLSKCI